MLRSGNRGDQSQLSEGIAARNALQWVQETTEGCIMAATLLGRTLVIANPKARSGLSVAAIDKTKECFAARTELAESCEFYMTKAAGDATVRAAAASGFDTVIAIGGDGIIHEVANGLMQIDRTCRPALAIIPFGSGNDIARTLGIPFNNAEKSLAHLATSSQRTIDVGCVNGKFFLETLSFGIDAAIAIDTTDKRAAGTKEKGEQLYVTSGVKYMVSGSKGYACTFSLDGGPEQHLRSLIFAIQNGPTYGGGFKICPKADPSDGQLDICFNVKKPAIPRLLVLFGLARFGKHAGSKAIAFKRARHIEIEYEDPAVPCQADGEEVKGSRFTVDLLPGELDVFC